LLKKDIHGGDDTKRKGSYVTGKKLQRRRDFPKTV
jgi:hypothetical protein